MSNDTLLDAALMMKGAMVEFSRAVIELTATLDSLGRRLDSLEELMRATTPETPPAPAPGGPNPTAWREWKGGFAPVETDTRVWVRLRDGQEIKTIGKDVQWRRYKDANYVVAYQRV